MQEEVEMMAKVENEKMEKGEIGVKEKEKEKEGKDFEWRIHEILKMVK